MTTQISVDEGGTLHINGEEKNVQDLSQEFLEQLVDDSLKSKVEYSIEGNMPLATFFRALDEGTKEGSELRNAMKQREEKAKEAEREGEGFVSEFTEMKVDDFAD